ncbi:MAG TPA: enolase C-terminal domain-like protein [Polyangiaceae bacterium]|nr:enolase C-terminal domain-like protein [Polyangiaceae bacterium]
MIATTIASVDAVPIDVPLTEPFAIAQGAPSLAANVLVTVTLADGTVGLGEAAPFTAVSGETQAKSLAAARGASWLVGRDARTYRSIAAELAEALGAEKAAACALETAVIDAFARHHGVPLWSFFGGAGTELDTDMTITAGDAAHAARAAEQILGRGIDTIKVKIGARSPAEDAARLDAVRRAAPRARLIVDANGAYSVDEARRFLAELDALNIAIALFEQPVAPGEWLAFMKDRTPSSVLMCADESARSSADLLRLVAAGAVDAVNLKPMKTGVLEAIAMWHVARAAGIAMMIGGMVETCLAMSLSAHLAAGLGGFAFVDLDTPMFVKEHPFAGGFEQIGKRLSVAHVEAGHGVSLRAG